VRAGAHRVIFVTVREILLVALAALAAVLFLNHQVLYLDGDFEPYGGPLLAYVLATLVIWMFLRAVLFAATMRPTRIRGGVEVCPECGQVLDDATPQGLETHRRVTLTPRPSHREVLAAVSLRKAVDGARVVTPRSHAAAGDPLARLKAEVENRPQSFDGMPGPRDDPSPGRSPKGPKAPEGRA